ncbi:MAG: heparan-alpha-glucosaminide N-acetyltransferase [Methanolobus sp.]|nr:heparan-alpha-glucosaminide N-acetyltransferase [Methanolobus sp.]
MGTDLRERFWEVDVFRGIAIILMVIYHIFFDLYFLGFDTPDIRGGFLLIIGRSAAIVFIFLVGVSLTLSYSRARLSSGEKWNLFPKYLKRGLIIFSWGLVITIVTGLFLERGMIVFGILHLIGVSIILAYPFLKYRETPLILGFFIILVGFFMEYAYVDFPWLLWIGLKPFGFYTYDYFPLIPWFGFVLLGIFTGNVLYKDYQRQFGICDCEDRPVVRVLDLLGRHSLFIYLVHQPIIVGLLVLLGYVDVGIIRF